MVSKSGVGRLLLGTALELALIGSGAGPVADVAAQESGHELHVATYVGAATSTFVVELESPTFRQPFTRAYISLDQIAGNSGTAPEYPASTANHPPDEELYPLSDVRGFVSTDEEASDLIATALEEADATLQQSQNYRGAKSESASLSLRHREATKQLRWYRIFRRVFVYGTVVDIYNELDKPSSDGVPHIIADGFLGGLTFGILGHRDPKNPRINPKIWGTFGQYVEIDLGELFDMLPPPSPPAPVEPPVTYEGLDEENGVNPGGRPSGTYVNDKELFDPVHGEQ